MSAQPKSKPVLHVERHGKTTSPKVRKGPSRLQSFLIELKTSIRLFGEALSEVKKLSKIVEGLILAWERAFVVFVVFALSVIGALTLLSWKIDLLHWVQKIVSLFQ